MAQAYGKLMVFSGNSNPELAKKIVSYLKVRLGNSELKRFSDGEIQLDINESVRGNDIFIIQPTSNPGGEHLMELLIFIDACKRSSAGRITAVIPYYGYARQDWKAKAREPITAKLVANLITTAGADRVLTLDLHSGQIQGFFDIPLDNLAAVNILRQEIMKRKLKELVVVASDAGAAKASSKTAKALGAGFALLNKSRPKPNMLEKTMQLVGEVKGKDCAMIDDMIDTAGTIALAAKTLKEAGAKKIIVCATHAVLSGPAIQRIEESALDEVIVTDSVSLEGKKCSKLSVVSVAPLIGEAIKRIHESESISELFEVAPFHTDS